MAQHKTPLLDKEFIAKIEQLQLVSRKVISGKLKGERRSKRRGYSIEFADYRPYVAGDDMRFLDWNIYGRLDRLFLKLYEEEEELWVNVLIDRSASMRFGEPDKFDYARRLAAAIGYIGLINNDRVRICAFSERMELVFAPARGRRQVWQLLNHLQNLSPDDGGRTRLGESCRDFAVSKKLQNPGSNTFLCRCLRASGDCRLWQSPADGVRYSGGSCQPEASTIGARRQPPRCSSAP